MSSLLSSELSSATAATTSSSMGGMSMSGASNEKNARLGAGAGIGGLALAVAYGLF